MLVGFMDEEVNEMLMNTLAACPQATVIAISANELPHHLFGRPLETYAGSDGCMKNMRIYDFGPTQNSEAQTVGGRLFEALSHLQRDTPAMRELERQIAPDSAVRTLHHGRLEPQLTVVEFPSRMASQDVIVVLRNIEMGRQPGLMRGYLDSILSAVKSKDLSIHVFGTSGGVSPDLAPGDVAHIGSSLYVGLEIDPDPHTPTPFHGIVSWASLGMNQSVRYFDQAFATRHEAEVAAIKGFLDPRLTADLSEAIRTANAHGFQASLTTSFFSGPGIKARAAELGILAVQMEDSHVLEAAVRAEVPVSIRRLITDPPHIPEVIRAEVKRWTRVEIYSVHTYEEAILWGLRGSRLKDLENNPELLRVARWKIFESAALAEFQDFAPRVLVAGEWVTVDPFFAEIAAEFLKEARDGHLFSTDFNGKKTFSGIINKGLYSALSQTARDELERLLNVKSEHIQSLANDLVAAYEAQDSELDLRGRIRQILMECLAINIAQNTALHREVGLYLQTSSESVARKKLFFENNQIRLLGANGFTTAVGPETIHMEKWIVQTRWDANAGRTARYLGAEGPSAPALDRLFYRSGLLTLTPSFARDMARSRLDFLTHLQMFGCDHLLSMGL